DHRHGRGRVGAGLRRVSRGRREPGRNWYLALRRPRAARTSAPGARRADAAAWRGGHRRFDRRRPPSSIKLNSSLIVLAANFPFLWGFLVVARRLRMGIIAPYHDNQHPLPDAFPIARSAH